MINTSLIAQKIEKGDFSGIRDAMDQSMAEGGQTFEQDIARLIKEGVVDRQEGMSNSDSPTNLLWRLQNDFQARSAAKAVIEEVDDQPSFTEFTLDVKH